ncbi:methyltransferase, TIGR04325 family [Rhodobacteraceae bacterium CCMM004]|nr:methyltransferase, TIGR04325 family [Rhodobacteraceae bacterium CCMM004]
MPRWVPADPIISPHSPGRSRPRRAEDAGMSEVPQRWPGLLATALRARLRLALGRRPRFCGVYPDRAAALAAVPPRAAAGYDVDGIAQVSRTAMTRLSDWDRPVADHLQRMLAAQGGLSVLDAGGHLATKYIAFATELDVARTAWWIHDLPAILTAARAAQEAGEIPAEVRFADTPAEAGAVDVLLCSGLLQYLDRPLADLVAQMAAPPPAIVLNKVATLEGDERVTLETIGPSRVPYRMRDRARFEAEIAAMGYAIADRWRLPGLQNRIDTHPWLPPCDSHGYVLERR